MQPCKIISIQEALVSPGGVLGGVVFLPAIHLFYDLKLIIAICQCVSVKYDRTMSLLRTGQLVSSVGFLCICLAPSLFSIIQSAVAVNDAQDVFTRSMTWRETADCSSAIVRNTLFLASLMAVDILFSALIICNFWKRFILCLCSEDCLDPETLSSVTNDEFKDLDLSLFEVCMDAIFEALC